MDPELTLKTTSVGRGTCPENRVQDLRVVSDSGGVPGPTGSVEQCDPLKGAGTRDRPKIRKSEGPGHNDVRSYGPL